MSTNVKQPNESRVYAINFANLISKGDTIVGVNALTATPSGLTLETPTVSTPRVLFRISGGTTGTLYKVTCRVQTTNGDYLEGEGDLEVVDL